jgi:hypothetical protein
MRHLLRALGAARKARRRTGKREKGEARRERRETGWREETARTRREKGLVRRYTRRRHPLPLAAHGIDRGGRPTHTPRKIAGLTCGFIKIRSKADASSKTPNDRHTSIDLGHRIEI